MTEIISPILFTKTPPLFIKTPPLFSKINHYKQKYFVIQILVQMFNVFSIFVFARIFCFCYNSSHLEWRAGLLDTILKGTHPRTIPGRFSVIWFGRFQRRSCVQCCQILWIVFVLCLVCPMLLVSLDCLRPVSWVFNVASFSGLSSFCALC